MLNALLVSKPTEATSVVRENPWSMSGSWAPSSNGWPDTMPGNGFSAPVGISTSFVSMFVLSGIVTFMFDILNEESASSLPWSHIIRLDKCEPRRAEYGLEYLCSLDSRLIADVEITNGTGMFPDLSTSHYCQRERVWKTVPMVCHRNNGPIYRTIIGEFGFIFNFQRRACDGGVYGTSYSVTNYGIQSPGKLLV